MSIFILGLTINAKSYASNNSQEKIDEEDINIIKKIQLPFALPSDEMLTKMEDIADKLPSITRFGKNESFDHYLKIIDMIMLASHETSNCRHFIENYILKDLPAFESVIDIGSGSGENTPFFAKHFTEVTLIDPNQQALDNITSNQLAKCEKLTKIRNTFQEADISSIQADLIVFAHVFYYIPQNEWITVLNKAFHSLNQDGVLFIVFNQGGSRNALVKEFGGSGTQEHFDQFARDLKKEYPNAEIAISQESIVTKTQKAMLQLCHLFLIDANLEVAQEQVIDFVEQTLKTEECYKATMDQVFIKIKKI